MTVAGMRPARHTEGMTRMLILLPLLLAACGEKQAAEDAALLRAARAGMNAVAGIPGGKTATFTQMRLVGGTTVCGMIDGNDGDGPRPFSAAGQQVQVADKRDPATAAAIAKTCSGQPVHEIVSRNPQFSDIAVAH
jgi:hypothetical protein